MNPEASFQITLMAIERKFLGIKTVGLQMGSSVHNSLVVGSEGLKKKFQDKPIFALCPINFSIGNFYIKGNSSLLLKPLL